MDLPGASSRDDAIEALKAEARRLVKARAPSPTVDVWVAKVRSLLISCLGANKSVLGAFDDVVNRASFNAPFQQQWWQRQQIILRDGLQLLETIETQRPHSIKNESKASTAPAVFVSHSGESPALGRLLRFISACGLRPLIAEREAFQGDTVPSHARRVMDECTIAVVFAEAREATAARRLPGPGLLVETGILQERFGDKVVYIVETGVELGAMLQPFAYTRFTQQCLEEVFERLVIEFRAHGLLRGGSPP